jgi:hypothetical protein
VNAAGAQRGRRDMIDGKDKRKDRRQPMRYMAWIALAPNDLHHCLVSDASTSGARIDIKDAEKFPDHFLLFLSNNGSARRICRVVWRNPNQLGVRFERSMAAAEKPATPENGAGKQDAGTQSNAASAETPEPA